MGNNTSKNTQGAEQVRTLKNQEAEAKAIELKGREDFFKLRKKWSCAIIVWISTLIVVNAVIIFGVGLELVDFRDYYSLVFAVVVENFLQIVGMGYIIVQFLYPKGIKN